MSRASAEMATGYNAIHIIGETMIRNQRQAHVLWLSVFAVAMSGCAIRPEIPVPTPQIQKNRQADVTEEILAPSQKAWQWDENRWFTAELGHTCRGPIRFLDEKNGIDTYVGDDGLPQVIFGSDDPDVVIGIVAGQDYRNQLVFSTDGGRHFVQEVRGLPKGQFTQFVVVRRGVVYIGMQLAGQHPDGYFEWRHPKYRSSWERGEEFQDDKLMILAAPLDKIRSRIGWYSLLAPKNFQFQSKDAPAARDDIVRVDNIESLGLPHTGNFPPSDACGRSIKLPPWASAMDKEQLLNYYNWYDSMKAAHPGWANAKTDDIIARHRDWHRAVLIPGATTPLRGFP